MLVSDPVQPHPGAAGSVCLPSGSRPRRPQCPGGHPEQQPRQGTAGSGGSLEGVLWIAARVCLWFVCWALHMQLFCTLKCGVWALSVCLSLQVLGQDLATFRRKGLSQIEGSEMSLGCGLFFLLFFKI